MLVAGWIECNGGGLVAYGFEEANSKLFANWDNGRKGGRKPTRNLRGTQPKPNGNPTGSQTGIGLTDREEKRRIGVDKSTPFISSEPDKPAAEPATAMVVAEQPRMTFECVGKGPNTFAVTPSRIRRSASITVKYMTLFVLLASAYLPVAAAEKARVFVLTDIENEPDEAMSLVRFLTYANHFDVDALSYTWFHYGEAGSLVASSATTGQPVPIKSFDQAEASFIVPTGARHAAGSRHNAHHSSSDRSRNAAFDALSPGHRRR